MGVFICRKDRKTKTIIRLDKRPVSIQRPVRYPVRHVRKTYQVKGSILNSQELELKLYKE
jgi:hypothetical protein